MNLQEYQQAALRTESIIDKLEFNKDFVIKLLQLFVLNTEILDAIKKEVYYKNSKKAETTLLQNLFAMEDIINDLKYLYRGRKECNEDIDLNPRVFHSTLGIATEAGELLNILVKYFKDGKEIDSVNAHEEMHDISWYMAILHDTLGVDWGEGLERNIAKLKSRYPEKFTEHNAIERDLETERKILEGNL